MDGAGKPFYKNSKVNSDLQRVDVHIHNTKLRERRDVKVSAVGRTSSVRECPTSLATLSTAERGTPLYFKKRWNSWLIPQDLYVDTALSMAEFSLCAAEGCGREGARAASNSRSRC
ncbi:hypothetical protein Trydic_g9925 [Trypoxylus dichotomus]